MTSLHNYCRYNDVVDQGSDFADSVIREMYRLHQQAAAASPSPSRGLHDNSSAAANDHDALLQPQVRVGL